MLSAEANCSWFPSGVLDPRGMKELGAWPLACLARGWGLRVRPNCASSWPRVGVVGLDFLRSASWLGCQNSRSSAPRSSGTKQGAARAAAPDMGRLHCSEEWSSCAAPQGSAWRSDRIGVQERLGASP
mmetsp:Transcript_4843/g.10630  ORF Transcript_4843/g.10630 Transcript_4843/m.10630 type:complete len:128 (-) Transcript_4843:29-412(-)